MTKHLYFCQEDKPEDSCEAYEGIAVVATSAECAFVISGLGYVEIMLRDQDASELPVGIVDLHEGLRRQIYGWVGGNCPTCNKYAKLFWDEDWEEIYCEECTLMQNVSGDRQVNRFSFFR